MKTLIVTCILLLSTAANAGWFSEDNSLEYKQRIDALEHQLVGQRKTSESWLLVAGALGIGCVLIFVIGTALGANTRTHYDRTRRMGPATLRGCQSGILDQTAEADLNGPLAA